jgi:hypothetical protein
MYMWGNRIMIWIITIQITQSWGCLIIQPKPSNSCQLLTLFYSSLRAEVAHLVEPQQPLLRTTSQWWDTITVYPPVWLKLERLAIRNVGRVFFFNCRLITLQYCGGFCHTLMWISTCVLLSWISSHLLPYPIPLGCPSASALSALLYSQKILNLHY